MSMTDREWRPDQAYLVPPSRSDGLAENEWWLMGTVHNVLRHCRITQVAIAG